MFKTSKIMIAAAAAALISVSACSREAMLDNTADAGVFVAKTAVKGTIGAGKLAVKGVKKVASSE